MKVTSSQWISSQSTGRAIEARRGDLLLPAGGGQWIDVVPGQDQSFRHLKG